MKKSKKNCKGFTLVEMILSLAIICMIGGVIAGLCVSISDSFITTYNVDDSADYALLYAKGFENSFLAATQGAGAAGDVWSWEVTNGYTHSDSKIPYLLRATKAGSEKVFEPRFIGSDDSSTKWDVFMFYKYDNTNETVYYRIFIRDNYSDNDFVYTYDGSFWVPRFNERAKNAGVSGSRSISVSSLPMTADTFSGKFKFTPGEMACISDKVETTATYYNVITYKWG